MTVVMVVVVVVVAAAAAVDFTQVGKEDEEEARDGSDRASIAMEEEEDAEVIEDAGANQSPLEAVVACGALAPERIYNGACRDSNWSQKHRCSPVAVWVSPCCRMAICSVQEWQRWHG